MKPKGQTIHIQFLSCILGLSVFFCGITTIHAEPLTAMDCMTGNLREAMVTNQKVIRADPTNVAAHVGLASCYIRQGQIGFAEQSAVKALSLDVKDVEALLIMAEVYRHKKQWKMARNHYEKAILQDSNESRAYLGLSSALTSLGKPQEADAAFEKSKALSSTGVP